MVLTRGAISPLFGRVQKNTRPAAIRSHVKVAHDAHSGMQSIVRKHVPPRWTTADEVDANQNVEVRDDPEPGPQPVTSVPETNGAVSRPESETASQGKSSDNTYVRAASVLSLGHMPLLLCSARGDEIARLTALLELGVDDSPVVDTVKHAASVYVCGTPGSGKTVTVGRVVNTLLSRRCLTQLAAADSEYCGKRISFDAKNDVTYNSGMRRATQLQGIWISCAGLQTPSQLFDLVAERLGVENGLDGIVRYARGQGPLGKERRAVLVLDEVDFMPTHILYVVYDWPKIPGSLLSVVGIANAIDLPFKALPWLRASNRMPDTVSFKPYTSAELADIVNSRLGELDDRIFPAAAVELAAKKVASGSGDARLVLDVCREAVLQLSQSVATSFPNQCHSVLSKAVPSTNPAVALSIVSEILDRRGGASTIVETIRALPLQQQLVICVVANAEKQWPSRARNSLNASTSSRGTTMKRNIVSHHATLGVLYDKFVTMCRELRIQVLGFSDFADICCTSLSENHGLLSITEKTKPRGRSYNAGANSMRTKIARLNAISISDVQAGVSDRGLLSAIVGTNTETM